MNTIVFVVVLISGYLYVNLHPAARYRFKRSTGWDAYFYVAVWGVIFTVTSWLLCSVLSILGAFRWVYNLLLSNEIITSETIARIFPLSYSGNVQFSELKFAFFCFISLVIAIFIGYLLRLLASCRKDSEINSLVNVVSDDPFESMLVEATVRSFPVIVTLSSRKVYVGLILCPQFEHGKIEYVGILPLLSGYREKDTLTVEITTNYRKHYADNGISSGLGDSQLSLEDFRTLIPKEEIEGISFFDTSTYSKFKASEKDDKPQCKSLTPDFMPEDKK